MINDKNQRKLLGYYFRIVICMFAVSLIGLLGLYQYEINKIDRTIPDHFPDGKSYFFVFETLLSPAEVTEMSPWIKYENNVKTGIVIKNSDWPISIEDAMFGDIRQGFASKSNLDDSEFLAFFQEFMKTGIYDLEKRLFLEGVLYKEGRIAEKTAGTVMLILVLFVILMSLGFFFRKFPIAYYSRYTKIGIAMASIWVLASFVFTVINEDGDFERAIRLKSIFVYMLPSIVILISSQLLQWAMKESKDN